MIGEPNDEYTNVGHQEDKQPSQLDSFLGYQFSCPIMKGTTEKGTSQSDIIHFDTVRNSPMKKLIMLTIFLAVCLGAIWYFGHQRPTQEMLQAEPKKVYKAVPSNIPEKPTTIPRPTDTTTQESTSAEVDLEETSEDTSTGTVMDDTVEIVQTGPLKGLPLDLAKEIHKEYTAASIARAKRYDEWYQRWQAHRERDRALFDKEIAHGDAILADSKKQRENVLAAFALMSPEQLEAARKDALKTQPAEVVDSFFTKVKEFGPVKTPEQIEQDAQRLQENKEVLARKLQELKVEREQFNRERDELQRTKPLPPNLGLDEFYTEWKKRNSTKPTPP